MPLVELTPRQKEVLAVIKTFHKQKGFAPSIRELCKKLHIASPHGVACHLDALEKKGYIKRGHSRRARAMILIDAEHQYVLAWRDFDGIHVRAPERALTLTESIDLALSLTRLIEESDVQPNP